MIKREIENIENIENHVRPFVKTTNLMKGEFKMKVKEVAKVFNMSEGNTRRILKTWKIGEEVKAFNLEGLKEYLTQKFGVEECERRLGFKIENLEIELGQRSEAQTSLSVDDLVKGESYVLRNYHFETNVEYVGEANIDDLTLWIFKSDKGFKAYSDEDINNGHFKILMCEE